MEQEDSSKKNLVTSLAVLVVIVIIVGGVVVLTRGGGETNNQETSDVTMPSSQTTSDTVDNPNAPVSNNTDGSYNDGTYTATGTYNSPGGRESISITVTLDDGKVIDTSATSRPSDSTARDFQNEFIKAYKQLVVGKDIDSIRLSQVSGSSLTSQGFNAALSQIKNQAKSQS